MIAQSALRTRLAAQQLARRQFSTTSQRLSSPYHYPEGPRSNLPFNTQTRFFWLRYWGTIVTGFSIPFVVAVTDGLPLTASAWDTSRDQSAIICAFGPTPTQPEIQLKRKGDADAGFTTIASWDAPCPLPDLDADEVLLLQYFADIETACLVLAGGDIVLVREHPTADQEQIEIVGSVDVGISAAAWAPDEQLLAVVTRTDSLVLMGRDFEPVTELTLSAEDLKVSKHVSVGWGKKETQFQGKRAKAMRDPTMPETVDEGLPSSREDGRVSLSWRGDGAYFSVNSVVPDHRRVIRVFDREAKLDSASEPVNGLEAALSWRPYGNLIAAIRRSTAKVEVVFFERNGLRHGEFDLRLSVSDMQTWASNISLAWNSDSTVLAVVYLDRVQLWTMGNYHYYLKQVIPLESQRSSPLAVRWHKDIPLRLTINSTECLLDLSHSLAISRGPVIPHQDHGVVAVIDGNTLKLTPLRQAGIPPPMSFCEVEADSAIIDCAVSSTGGQIAVLTTSAIHIWTWPIQAAHAKPSRYTTPVNRRSKALPPHRRYSQIRFRGSSRLFILSYDGGVSRLHSVACADASDLSDLAEHDVVSVVHNIFADTTNEYVWASGSGSASARVVSDDTSVQPDFLPAVPGPSTPDTAIFRCAGPDQGTMNGHHEPEYHRISLTSQGILEGDNRLLARDCSSFVVTDTHLIFTTTHHLLKFVHLTAPAAMAVPEDTPETDERVRSIERGGKIVTVIPSTYAVVLQMPRGNLETIYPRALVVSGIRKHLEDQDFQIAFLACRQHQVDLNILHDYNPDAFISNMGKFIDQVKKPARIDEFLSKLKEEDVTQTLYRDTSKSTSSNSAPPSATTSSPSPSKINRICSEFLTALSIPPLSTTYLTTLLTAHVCKRPPDLAAALTLVSTLHSQSPTQADTAVAHLCFLSEPNHLYTTALGLYDLDVTLLIAQHSQRDPREYMPFLQSLNSLSLLRRRYTIDNHLKRYAKALASLVALESHDEAEAYTLRHTLYTDALDLYKYSLVHRQQYTRLYAAHLASQSQNMQAAVLYESLGDYASAQALYALAHRWRESLTCATLVPVSPSNLTALATQLATTQVEEHRDYRAAAYIHEHYLHDPTSAATLLCKGSYFAEALLLLSQRHHRDPPTPTSFHTQATSIVDPVLLDKSSELLSLLNDCTTQLSSQLPRILELRRIKALDPLAFYGGDPAVGAGAAATDMDDTISLAPTASTVTNQSMFTRYNNSSTQFGGTIASQASRKTSKTRRREERKRARGKKGSVYEEEYLVASIGRLVDRVNGVHDEVGRLCLGLVRRGMRDRARQVDEAMRATVARCDEARAQVWVGAAVGTSGEGNDEAMAIRPRGGDGVLWDAQNEVDAAAGVGAAKKDVPEVKVWKGDLFS
ncbi:hypothetical protein DV737_g413, partial [Chaetothyriales sp. CBS 132003]